MIKAATAIIIALTCSGLLTGQDTRNGYFFPTEGHLKIIIVFADCIGDNRYVHGWERGLFPEKANSLIDTTFTSRDKMIGLLSKYFYDMSFGKMIVTGDYYPQVIQVHKDSLILNGDANVLSALKNGTDTTFNGYTIANHFDNWRLNKNHYPKENKPDGFIDMLFIIWRVNPYFKTSRQGSVHYTNSTTDIFGLKGTNSIGRMASFDFDVLKHELSHGFIGGNEFHCATANAGVGTFIANYSGISMLSGDMNFGNMAHPQERRILGWVNDSCPEGICARNENNQYKNADLLYKDISTQGDTFYLKDYVVYGDAVRIELPYLNQKNSNTSKQWLWLVNHQKENADFKIHNACKKGIYAYLQVGVEGHSNLNAKTNYFIPIDRFGNYDFIISDTAANSATFNACEKLNNPFTGASIQMSVALNFRGNDNIIGKNENKKIKKLLYEGKTLKNEVFDYKTYTVYGTSLTAFVENDQISINENPSTAPLLTYKVPYRNFGNKNYYAIPAKEDNRIVYLNNLRILIKGFTNNGNAIVIIDKKGYNISGNKRWCGPIVLYDSLFLHPHSRIELAQGLTAQRPNKPIEFNNTLVFADPTYLHIDSSAWLKMKNATIEIRDNSTLSFNPFSNAVLENSTIIIRRGSRLNIAHDVSIKIKGRNKIIVEGQLITPQDKLQAIEPHIKIKKSGTIIFSTDNFIKEAP